jgi:hypothetical protein
MHAALGAGIVAANRRGVSYVPRSDGRAVREMPGEPVEIDAVTMGHQPAFLWFTREGKAYLVTDEAALARVGALHAPASAARLLAGDVEETVGERLRRLADELVTSGAARPFDR